MQGDSCIQSITNRLIRPAIPPRADGVIPGRCYRESMPRCIGCPIEAFGHDWVLGSSFPHACSGNPCRARLVSVGKPSEEGKM